MALDLTSELHKIDHLYDSESQQQTATMLVLGDYGTGKTRLFSTCPGPVLLHTFDPRGAQTLKKWIDTGHIHVDPRFQFSTRTTGDLYSKWLLEMQRLKNGGIFEQLGTFGIDSFSSWSDALLRHFKGAWQDWSEELNRIVYELVALPCNIVLTGHLEIIKDEITGNTSSHMYTPGRVKYWVPRLFSEVYVLKASTVGQEITYELLTQNNGYYKARTRIGAEGLFKSKEIPDIRALLKKAGFPFEDKSLVLPKILEDKKEQTEETKNGSNECTNASPVITGATAGS